MTSKERVKAVINHVAPDKLPMGFFAVDCDTIEKIIGRPTYLRAKAKSQIALWEGKRDEVIESWKNDFIEFYKKMDFIDILNLSPQSTAWAPSANEEMEIPKKIDANTYQFMDGSIHKYSDITRDLTLVQSPNDDFLSFKSYEEKDYNFSVDIDPPANSQFEVIDPILDAFKNDNKYIIGAGYQEALFQPPNEMEYYDHPEWIEKASLATLTRANKLDEYIYRKEYDGIMWGADFSHNKGSFVSPDMFKKFYVPYFKERVKNVKKFGLDVHKHACGNNWKLLDMFVEIGYDSYQSIQESATMDTKLVKEKYGDKLTLWAGPQVETLMNGSKDDIKKEVQRMFEIAQNGSGFIFSTSHSVAVGTKFENFMTMVEEFLRLNAKCF
jgi:hypothetical protein